MSTRTRLCGICHLTFLETPDRRNIREWTSFASYRAKAAHTETDMNWDRIEGNWKQFKGQVQQQWGKLTDDDFDVIAGKRQELTGKIQERYGYQKEKAEQEIDDWMKNVRH